MFTVEQIKTAHSKVKSGEDFPAYILEIAQLGVTAFETWVIDSHTEYFGSEGYTAQSQPMYDDLLIAGTSDAETFRDCLKSHQQGKTDYMEFCRDCAATGIEKWFVNFADMTCTYYDKSGKVILVENIPV